MSTLSSERLTRGSDLHEQPQLPHWTTERTRRRSSFNANSRPSPTKCRGIGRTSSTSSSARIGVPAAMRPTSGTWTASGAMLAGEVGVLVAADAVGAGTVRVPVEEAFALQGHQLVRDGGGAPEVDAFADLPHRGRVAFLQSNRCPLKRDQLGSFGQRSGLEAVVTADGRRGPGDLDRIAVHDGQHLLKYGRAEVLPSPERRFARPQQRLPDEPLQGQRNAIWKPCQQALLGPKPDPRMDLQPRPGCTRGDAELQFSGLIVGDDIEDIPVQASTDPA